MIDLVAVAIGTVSVALLSAAILRRLAEPAPTRVRSVLRHGAVVLGALALVLASAFAVSRSRSIQVMGDLVRRVDTSERIVALTFDDGPTSAGGTRILDELSAAGVRATFFVTGSELEANPEIGRRMAADGHELGNHTWSHRRMVGRPLATVAAEVERTDSAIRSAGYEGDIHFRAPNSHKLLGLPYYLARRGRTSISYDIEPDSYPEIAVSPEAITRHVEGKVRPGSIILLHVMYPSRAASLAAVPSIIDELRSAGYRFVTVSELLAHDQSGRR